METTTNDDNEDRKENGNNATINEHTYLKMLPTSSYGMIDIRDRKVVCIDMNIKRYSG